MSLRTWSLPFVKVFGGVISDYVTTAIGLGMGFCEANPKYNPVLSLAVFCVVTAILTLALPREKPWNLTLKGIAVASYFGAINNALVILGLIPG
ncbi:MAG: hypothetical protein NWE76_08570 [Candidatus Bathyarchaeota archaeon]|nr:hypothetical protein [Candidatus Bathyarchaeota archaeon]